MLGIKLGIFSELDAAAAGGGAVTDYDGNEYTPITIGTQTWLKENLRTTSYNNGDSITLVTTGTWGTTSAKYGYFDNDTDNIAIWGNHYNWYAVVDARGIAPTGYHVATEDDWITLRDYIRAANGGSEVAALKLKSTSGWAYNYNGTDDYGFTALPAGKRRFNTGVWEDDGEKALFWTSETDEGTAFSAAWYAGSLNGPSDDQEKGGYSVRCVKD
tara:strand:- start:2 stop:646 length:645 start_codon:yes stop_codon:yes gene_type:complete